MGWDASVILACEELPLAGAESPQVSRRLRAALDDLGAACRNRTDDILITSKVLCQLS